MIDRGSNVRAEVEGMFNGNKGAGTKIKNQISQNLNELTSFIAALEGLCKQRDAIAIKIMDTYEITLKGLVTSLNGEHTDVIKEKILEAISDIIAKIDKLVTSDIKLKVLGKCLFGGLIIIAGVLSYKNPKVAGQLLSKLVSK